MWWLIVEANATNSYMIPAIQGRRYYTDSRYWYIMY